MASCVPTWDNCVPGTLGIARRDTARNAMKLKLTATTIATKCLPTTAERTYYWDSSGSGFGVEVSSKTGRKVFVVRKRHEGKLVKRSIGALGEPWGKDGHLLTYEIAKRESEKLVGTIRSGEVPETKAQTRSGGPTLRDALAMHVRAMRNDDCAERSIETIESEIPRLLPEFMDRPIVDIKRSTLRELHDRLVDEEKPFLARRIKAQVSAVWNTLEGASDEGLDGKNPSSGWNAVKYTPSRERLDAHEMPGWYAKVTGLAPVRRDLQLFCLFTGMRSEAARSVRWEHIDEKARALVVPKPKGGEGKAFTLPLPSTVVKVLAERRSGNRDIFGPYGGDHGWVFPSLTRAAPFEVQPLAEPKEYRFDDAGKRVAHLPGLHTLRRTYLSVATEAGVTELDRSVLANHSYGRQSVNQTYIAQAFEHLAGAQAKIEAALWERLEPAAAKKRSARRRAA
jgi:integrase